MREYPLKPLNLFQYRPVNYKKSATTMNNTETGFENVHVSKNTEHFEDEVNAVNVQKAAEIEPEQPDFIDTAYELIRERNRRRMAEMDDKKPAPVEIRKTPAFVKLVAWIMFIMLLAIGVVVGFAFYYYENNVSSQFVTDYRPCEFNDDQTTNPFVMVGTRSYYYRQYTLDDYSWNVKSKVMEQTEMEVPFNGLIIVAINKDGTTQTVKRGRGEGGKVILPQADYYSFYSGTSAGGISYGDLCK